MANQLGRDPSHHDHSHRDHSHRDHVGSEHLSREHAPGEHSHTGLARFLSGELPLQNETTWFIFANCLDVFMTYILIRSGAIESNPVANYFLQNYGFAVMIYYKMGVVAFVCVVTQLVAWKNLAKARWLMRIGILIVGAVVVYSSALFVKHFL